MADDYDHEGDGIFDYDDDWLYIDDEFALADELAEGQIADPGYAGTNGEIDMDRFEDDNYAFWDDLEYGNDEYWDYAARRRSPDLDRVGQKRKHKDWRGVARPEKRRRFSDIRAITSNDDTVGYDSVVYMSRAERKPLSWEHAPVLKEAVPYALLPDWRIRYSIQDGSVHVGHMPVDMQQAAEGRDESKSQEPTNVVSLETIAEGAEIWHHGSFSGEAEGVLNQQIMRLVLTQKLRDVGLEGVDESVFTEAINKMLADGDGDSDVAGDLAATLIAQARRSAGSTLSDWIAQRDASRALSEDVDGSFVLTAEQPQEPKNYQLKKSRLEGYLADNAVDGSATDATTAGSAKSPGLPGMMTGPTAKIEGRIARRQGQLDTSRFASLEKTKESSDKSERVAEPKRHLVSEHTSTNGQTTETLTSGTENRIFDVADIGAVKSSGRANSKKAQEGTGSDFERAAGLSKQTRKRKAPTDDDDVPAKDDPLSISEPASKRTRGRQTKDGR